MSIRISRGLVASVASVVAALAGAGVVLAPPAAHGAAPAGTKARDAALTAQLDGILADPVFRHAQVGLEVRNARTGDVLYSHDAADRLLPASNAKLLTSTAAMDVLGPSYRFRTSVATTGKRSGHTLKGDLYLRGTGDPTMLGTDYDALAAKVAASGVRTIRGDLVADDTWFDDQRLAPFWAWDDEPYYYNGQVSALTVAPNTDYDAGSVIVQVAPGGRAGAPAKVTMIPANRSIRIVNHATTGAKGSDDTADAVRRHGSNVVDVTGSIPAGADADQIWATIWKPTPFVSKLFADALRKHGVKVTGDRTYAATPRSAATLASHRSMTLSDLLTPFLKLSNNMHAEHLTKAMGRTTANDGSWPAGTAATLAAMKKLGLDTDDVSLVDGSGLSRADLVSPHQVTTLLLAAQKRPWFKTWYTALPIAGEPDRLVGGTLRNRMRGTAAAGNLHAKTGSMTSVQALSGYVTDASGDPLVFSMITNDFLGSVTASEDKVGVALASYDGDAGRTAKVTAPRATHGHNAMQRRHPDLECAWTKSC